MIEDIVVDVSNELINYAPSSDFDGLIGMRAHMEKMERFLLLGSDEVRMVGIWGPLGIGKSTLARVLFNQHSHEFQLSVFMDDIKRHYPRLGYNEYSMQLKLQKDFLSQIINQKDIKIHHLGVVQDRLKDKRVLAVLDDVDHSLQLDAMAKEARWFGPGSRIIITTQDKKLLKAHKINHIYKMEFPSSYEAFQIFCTYAFGQNYPYDDFEDLAWEVTELCGKLPLALKVIGSYLKRMSKQEWEEDLPRLRVRLDGETESTLMFSYDALCDEDKDLFLHIACFFKDEPIERVEEYLADKFVGVKGRLRVLAEKSFISVDYKGCIKMHDLLARLGVEIVRKQSIQEPGQRQFLVDAGDICQVLRNDTLGSPSVIGIYFKYEGELKISDRAFERMTNVQFLRFHYNYSPSIPMIRKGVNFIQKRKKKKRESVLPPYLKLLDWRNFPKICLPSNFNPEFLVETILPQSDLEKLWEGNKNIRNLKWMDLGYSENLKELPDLSTATNLQKLDLHGCSSLRELPFFIGNAINLQELNLYGCSSLVELPYSIGNVTNLEKLDLNKCSSLVELPSSIGNLINLEKLELSECSSLRELPSSIGNLSYLEELDLNSCSSLVDLPYSIGNLTNLDKLYLSSCSSLVELPYSIGNLTYLDKLYLTRCTSLVELPYSIGNLTNLKKLCLVGCLVELPSSIGNMIYLRTLNLAECSILQKLPSSIGNLTKLEKLELERCTNLVELPSSIGDLTYLKRLDLRECSNLFELPTSIGNLTYLRLLLLIGCSKLKSLPININMKSLALVDLTNCSLLKSFPEISTNIRVLKLTGTAIEEIPPSIRSWPRLDILDMSYCENLRKSQHAFDRIRELHLSDTRIQEIAPWIKEMSRLTKLIVKGCAKLVSLPQLPDSLRFLDAENCESLERLDCSFNKTEFAELKFLNCLKLNQEARDLIIKTPRIRYAVFPGEAVPTYFSYRAIGSSLSMKSNGFDTDLRFKACLLLVNKGDVEASDGSYTKISYCIKDKLSGVVVHSGYSSFGSKLFPPLKAHIFVFEFETHVSFVESVFEFSNESLEIEECGIRPLKSLYPSW